MRAPEDFVPHAVRLEAERLTQTRPRTNKAVQLLKTDPRMKQVWRALQRRKPTCSRADLDALEKSLPATMTDAALVVVFRHCVFNAVFPDDVETFAEANAEIKKCNSRASRLRQEASNLRKQRQWIGDTDADVDARAKNLESVAAWCEQEARVIHNKYGDPTYLGSNGTKAGGPK